MIVVTAPSGNIGGKLLPLLLDGDEPVRVIVRDPAKLPDAVRARVEVTEGSHGDAATVDRAVEGARAVFWLPPGDPKAVDADAAYVGFSRPAIEAIAERGIAQVVAITALGYGWPRPAGHITASLAMDDLFVATGTGFRGLACASLMENVLRQAASIRDDGAFYGVTPRDMPTRQVASEDVAAAAARLLRDPDWTGSAQVPLIGPADITYAEMEATIADVLGKPVRYHEIGMEDLRRQSLARGASAGMADAMVEMMTAKNEGMDDLVARTPDVSAATPTTFRRWCETVLKPAVVGRNG